MISEVFCMAIRSTQRNFTQKRKTPFLSAVGFGFLATYHHILCNLSR